MLWAIYSCWVLGQLDSEVVRVRETNTSYADDLLFAWKLLSGRDLELAYEGMRQVLRGLKRRGLQVSVTKTVIILELLGPGAANHIKRYVVELPDKDGQFVKFLIEGEAVYVQVVQQHVYLGACISYRKFEQDTFARRATLTRNTFSRLEPILKCRQVPMKLRLLLWQGTVLPTLLHGLDTMGLPPKEAQQLLVLFYKQVRSIAKSFSMFTHESNTQLAVRLGLPDPLSRLLQAVERRDRIPSCRVSGIVVAGPPLLRWREILRGQLVMARGAQGASAGHETKHISLQLTLDSQIGQFACPTCGVSYATAASLKRHQYRSHMNEEEQIAIFLDNKRALRSEVMHHALSGMPQCRHCTKKFTTWHAFFYHINARGCQDLRDFFASDGPKDKAAPASDALVDSPEILELTQHCTWRDVALHPRTRSSLHHCPECYQWAVKPSYVRRHMLARHKEQLPIIERSQELINRSVLGLHNPCQFCGTAYQRKSAHLKACAGIFNGVYVILRVGRGKELRDLSEDKHGTGQTLARQHGDGHGGATTTTGPGTVWQRRTGPGPGHADPRGRGDGDGGDGAPPEVPQGRSQGLGTRPKPRQRKGAAPELEPRTQRSSPTTGKIASGRTTGRHGKRGGAPGVSRAGTSRS